LHPAPNFLNQRANFVNGLLSQCAALNVATYHTLCKEALSLLHRIEAPDSSLMPHAQQTIHGDLHREHLLFAGDTVTGIIDFSSTKLDHPAVDLARFLGDFEDGDITMLKLGVEAYRAAGGNEAVTLGNVQYLYRVITLGSAATWVLRFVRGEVPVEKSAAAAARLERIVARLRRQVANAVSGFGSFS
jgi:aminoglycoside phosphotransferase (APT) family kinase protein